MLISYIKEQVLKCIELTAEKNAQSISAAMTNNKAFSEFRNICAGKSVVVCGAGPSLNNYKPIENAVHIALNRAFLYEKVKFDYIFAQDYDGIKMVQNELVKYEGNNCIKSLSRNFFGEKSIPESFLIDSKAKIFVTDSYLYQNGYKSKFVNDIDCRAIGGMPNVGFSSLQFAMFMNPSKLYIVGCDMSGQHFVQKNQSDSDIKAEKKELEATWKNDFDRLLAKWDEFKIFAHTFYPNTEIISVNPVGLKGKFIDLYQE